MKNKILFVLFVSVLVLASCNTMKNTDNSFLKNNWTHSYEEDKGDVRVFKPTSSQDFAPSMYRLSFVLKENNEAQYLVLSPVDAHYMEAGQWSYNPNTHQLVITDKNDKTVHQYEVIKVTNSILRVKELPLP